MIRIYNISPGFLIAYKAAQEKKEINMEDIFKALSFEMGGDGKSITKAQLNSYIQKAEDGSIEVGGSKLNALKKIQSLWDTISNGKDSISYSDMKNYSILLAATMSADCIEIEDNESKSSLSDSIYDYLVDYYKLSSKDDVKESHLKSYLKELLSKDTSDNESFEDSDNELIDSLTNMIASCSSSSSVEKVA